MEQEIMRKLLHTSEKITENSTKIMNIQEKIEKLEAIKNKYLETEKKLYLKQHRLRQIELMTSRREQRKALYELRKKK